MNGPIRMYRTTQVIRHDLPVELPKCMYPMTNIHRTTNGMMVDEPVLGHVSSSTQKLDILDQNNADIPEMAALEAKQEQILQQLAELKTQMQGIKNNLKITNSFSPVPVKLVKNVQQVQPCLSQQPDIIINASPTYPPHSLRLVQKLWQNIAHLAVTHHLHSSVSVLDDKAATLSHNLENFTARNGVPKVRVRLIWKDVGANTQLILSPTPIIGEINILRYLARISSDHLNYELLPNPQEIDNILDVSYRIAISKTKTERTALLQSVNKALGKSTWLYGRTNISVGDIGCYSVIRQVCAPNEINVNLTKWLERCAAI